MPSSHIHGGFLFQEHPDGLVDVAPYPRGANPGVSVPADHLTAYVLGILAPEAGDTANRTFALRRALFGDYAVPDAVLSPPPDIHARFKPVSRTEIGLPGDVAVTGTRVGEAYPYDGSDGPEGDLVVPFPELRSFVFSRLQSEVARRIDDADPDGFEALALFVIRGGMPANA